MEAFIMKIRNISGKDQVFCGNYSLTIAPNEVIEAKLSRVPHGFEEVKEGTVSTTTTDQRGDSNAVSNQDGTVSTAKGLRGAFKSDK